MLSTPSKISICWHDGNNDSQQNEEMSTKMKYKSTVQLKYAHLLKHWGFKHVKWDKWLKDISVSNLVMFLFYTEVFAAEIIHFFLTISSCIVCVSVDWTDWFNWKILVVLVVLSFPAGAELWLSTSWCTTVAVTSRVSKDSSGCPAPSRASTQLKLAPRRLSPQRSWTWLWIQHWSLLLRPPSLSACRACWETSLIPTWLNCQTDSPSIALMHNPEDAVQKTQAESSVVAHNSQTQSLKAVGN